MAALNARVGLVAALFVVCGLFARQSVAHPVGRDEQWLASVCPATVGNAQMSPGPGGTSQYTYKMDSTTYKELNPYGIVARVFDQGPTSVDTVVIASNNKESFHDPRVCFTAQGWTIEKEETVKIPTTAGAVPATLATLGGKGESLAVFLYKGPAGYVASTTQVKMDLFMEKLLHRRSSDGIFYRFIRLTPTMSKQAFLEFVGRYLDDAQKSSNGYL